ncbi:NAD(P)H-hydrate epimerase, partial [Sphingomonas sp.]|uniref:NAD(P)H-hydrate epimerase n=1 Tax=Sphingomonas sp. TaxID=28214 RepID=UPI003B3A4AB2
MTDLAPILSAREMRAAEQRVMDGGCPVETLMERAGAAVAELVWRVAGHAETLILCGPGNNGGDGYVAARLLQARGVPVRVAVAAPPASDAARKAATAWDGPRSSLAEARPAAILVDALFGTGLTRPVAGEISEDYLRLCGAAQRRIAVDLPSGVTTDDGKVLGAVPYFHLTVALGALKPAHRLLPAAEHCGRVIVADIGLGSVPEASTFEIGRPRLASPGYDANKYSRGKLVVLAGAMPGASLLSALAGQRTGAGYVELLGAPGEGAPHALVRRDWSDKAVADPRIGALVVGPGLGLDCLARDRLDAALASGKPIVLDADALTLIGRRRHDRLAGHVLTPHWGEFVRLFGDSKEDRLSQARAAAATSGA